MSWGFGFTVVICKFMYDLNSEFGVRLVLTQRCEIE